MDDQLDEQPQPRLPAGDYAIVELLGHRTVIGRIEEIERFGSKLLQIEPLFENALLAPTLHHGSSIYALTPVLAEVAQRRQAKARFLLPPATRATLPPEALPSPLDLDEEADGEDF